MLDDRLAVQGLCSSRSWSLVLGTEQAPRRSISYRPLQSLSLKGQCSHCPLATTFDAFVTVSEILALRHQLFVLQRSSHGHRLRLGVADRFLWVWLARFSDWLAIGIAHLEARDRHRLALKGFRLYWKWKSRPRCKRISSSSSASNWSRCINILSRRRKGIQ
jgi:hypothetical protein